MYFRKSLPILLSALALAAIPSFAMTPKDLEDAKGIFRDGLDNPKDVKSTGVQYWIELKRGSQHVRVSNQYPFKTGDQVRFHVTPNIDGYAYVLLKSGSRGERAVLFPNEKAGESNSVARGKEILIPGDGSYLCFDNNPGTEKLSLVVSRTPINATAYLDNEAPVMIASVEGGSKDLIPTKVYVSYGVPHGRPIGEKEELIATAVHEKKPFEPAATPSVVKEPAVKKVTTVKKTTTVAKKPPVEKKPVRIAHVQHSTSTHHSSHGGSGRIEGRVQVDSQSDSAVTTVVQRDGNALQLDVTLDHN